MSNSGIFHTVAVERYDTTFMNAVVNETKVCLLSPYPTNPTTYHSLRQPQFWSERLAIDIATFVSYDIEPFLPDILTHGSDSAYPADRSKAYLPTNLYFAWLFEADDKIMHDAITQSAAQLTAVAKKDGQNIDDAALYGNYAIYDTPVERIYGSDNLNRLKAIKTQYDPNNVMGLAGGWKF